MRDDGGPESRGDSTVEYPDQVETRDARGGRSRAARDAGSGDSAEHSDPGITIGRYQLLKLVGTGGMGMVWGAWDPDLERRVALKLMRVASHESRERMLREGQILAKLSHPNVVPIYDVGEIGSQVYLVMEWVRGTTLRMFAAEAPGVPAVVDAYRQAAQGLSAAHGSGVIHRDFKPDNAIRGEDGRVRVLDFGIAYADTKRRPPGAMGTPRYMAPEQARGDAVTAASDQYALCVSLREALEKTGGVPAWLVAIIERGTAEDPVGRFASIDELLAALRRDPSRRRRRATRWVVAVVAAIGAFEVGRTATPEAVAPAPCTGGPEELAGSWGRDVRERALANLRALGPAASTAAIEGLARKLDEHAAAWLAEYHDTCMAAERRELTPERTPQLHEARFACLHQARSLLGSVGELLGNVRTAADLIQAQRAPGALFDVRACRDASPISPPPERVASQVRELGERIERTLVRAVARDVTAHGDAAAITRLARATAYAPLVARALLVEGRAAAVPHIDPRELYAESMTHALRAGDDPAAVEAYARWTYETGIRGGSADEDWRAMAAIAERLGARGRFARALLYGNRGVARTAARDRAGALELYRRAQDIAQSPGGDDRDIELVSISQNLALLESEPAAAEQTLGRAVARLEAGYGPAHPDTLVARIMLARVARDRPAARRTVEDTCRTLEQQQQARLFAHCALLAGWLADERDDLAAAASWMKRVTRGSTDDLNDRIASAYVAITEGTPGRDALVELERFAAQTERAGAAGTPAAWWERVLAGDALVVLARAAAPGAADRLWQRAVAMFETVEQPTYRYRVARVQRVMAERWATRRPADARRLAAAALAWYRAVQGEDAAVARLDSVLRAAPEADSQ